MAGKKKAIKSGLRGRIQGKEPTGKGKLISREKLIQIERRFKVMEMRRDGYSVHQIATALHVTEPTVSNDIKACMVTLVEHTTMSAEEHRALDSARVDELIRVLTPMTQPRTLDVPNPKYKPDQPVDPNTNPAVITIEVPPSHTAIGQLTGLLKRRAEMNASDTPEIKQMSITGVREYVGIDVDKV